MQFSYCVYESDGDKLLAIADNDVIGKTLNGQSISLEVRASFYSGKKCTSADVAGLAANATIINAVGKNVVMLMVETGIVDENMVLNIGGVPHAQVVRV